MILPVRLSAPSADTLSAVATVDTSVPYFRITEELAGQLGLEQIDTRLVLDENGEQLVCPFVGPLLVEARGVKSHMDAVVYGSEIVLGRSALSALGLVADERHGKVYSDAAQVRLSSARVV